MSKILKNTVISLLIIAFMAALCSAAYSYFFNKEEYERPAEESWRQEIEDWESRGFVLVKDAKYQAYLVNKTVETRTKYLRNGNIFKDKFKEVFYIGDLLSLYNPLYYGHDYDKGIKYRIAKCVVTESENKCYRIKVTAYNKKDAPVRVSAEEDWKSIDWSNINETQPDTIEYAYISAIKELGSSE